MNDAPDVSVIIPAWNEEHYITATLEAVFVAVEKLRDAGGSAEVIVVDNCSGDRTAEFASAFPVRVVTETRRCIASVRNRGAREARGRFFAFVDADSHPSANSLVRISRLLDGGRHVGGGVLILPDRWSMRVLPLLLAAPLVIAASLLMGVSAGMIFAVRKDFEAAGGFDENFYAAEDLDFVRRLKLRGVKSGKKFANLTDVHIRTSVRKFEKARLADWLIFPKYILDRRSVRRVENCRLWYAPEHR